MRTIVCRDTARWIAFLFGLVLSPSLALSQSYTPTEQACYSNVQGKIALQPGQTTWPEAQARALCKGARAATPRGACFKTKSPTLGVEAAIEQCSLLGQPAGSQPPSPQAPTTQPEPIGSPSEPPALTPGATLRGVTIPGDDMTILPNTDMTANSCAASCNSNIGCVAWTLVRRGAQATSCHLKNAISREVFSGCCISGMAEQRGATAPPPPPATGTYTATEQACYSNVQGRIALQPGQTTWPEAEARALCKGARAATPRGNCFKTKSPTLGVEAAIEQCSQLGQVAGSQPPSQQAPTTPPPTTPPSTTAPPSAPSESERACYANVQDKIAWNAQGQKHWPPSLLGGLCRNAPTAAGPGACFQKSRPHIGLRAAINICAQKDGPVGPALMYTAQEQACYSHVQGKIAIDKTGQKQWPEADARMLCDGARAAAPRALCYQSRMPVMGGKASIEDCKLLGVAELPKLIVPPPPQTTQGTFVSPPKGGGTIVGVAPTPPAILVPNQLPMLAGQVFEIDAKKGFACALLPEKTSSDLTIWCEKFGTWVALNRSAMKIAVDVEGNIWTVDKTGQVFEGTNNGTWLSPSWTWTPMLGPGVARDIALLHGSLVPYIAGTSGDILNFWPPPANTVFWLCKQNLGVLSIRTASISGWLQVKTTSGYTWLVLDHDGDCSLGPTIPDSMLPATYRAAAIDSDSSIWGIDLTGKLVHEVGGTAIAMSNPNVGPAPTLVPQPVPPPPPPGANSYGIVQIPIRSFDFGDWGYTAAEQTCNQMLQEQVDVSKPPPPPQYDYNNRWSADALSALCNNTHDPLATVTCFKNHVAADGWNAEKTLRGCATTPPPATRHVNFTIYAPTPGAPITVTPDQLDPAYVTTVPSPLSLADLQSVLSWISSRVAAVHAPYCYKQTSQPSCPDAQPTSCGAGCAVSSSSCGSVTASQVLSPILLAINIATLASDTELKEALDAALLTINDDSRGADTALNEYLRAQDEAALAKDALDVNSGFVTRTKNAIASRISNAANAAEDFAGGKASFTTLKANATGANGSVSIYQGGARLVVSYQGSYASNFAAMTSPDIDKAINQKFGPQGAKYIKMQYASYAFALSMQADGSGNAADILPIFSFYDPTGIISVVQAYNHPVCDYGTPMPSVTPLYNQ